MTTTKKAEPKQTAQQTVRGPHDVAEHGALASGSFRNVGETDRFRTAEVGAGKRPAFAETSKSKSEG